MSNEFELRMSLARNGSPVEQREFAYYCIKDCPGNPRWTLALEFFRKAADAGDAESQYMVGVIYIEGLGRKANPATAKKWFIKSAHNGFAAAQEALSKFFSEEAFQKPATNAEVTCEKTRGFSFSDFALTTDQDGKPKFNILNIRAEDVENIYSPSKEYKEALQHQTGFVPVYRKTLPDPDIDPQEALNNLVGLHNVKLQIDAIEKKVLFHRKRLESGLKSSHTSNHMVFTGNPGTGKNEVARILGAHFKTIGLLSHGHVIEVDRTDLVGAWIGHTALKTALAIEEAIGGILFIDEAYSLYDPSGWDFGMEAVETLMKAMEDRRHEFIVIMAGYEKNMNDLLRQNVGLKSRVRHHLKFEDYGADELMGIFDVFIQKDDFVLNQNARMLLERLMKKAVKLENKNLGNGRFVRNVFEKCIENMARRVMTSASQDQSDLQTITPYDIPNEDILGGGKKSTKGNGEIVEF